ncbi:MAG: RNA polymerase sigma factor [Bdellovibrionales bacterium]|nr:RNA polymerase sigma factor [Bdellovibrionales bacterium]
MASDEELMRAYVDGDSDAFRELFMRSKGKVYGFLFRRLGSQSTAEDLFQITWLKVHQNRASFDSSQKFMTWLFTIAQNSMIDHWKKASTRYERVDEDLSKDGAGHKMPEVDAEARLLSLESEKLLQSAIDKLPVAMREAIILCDLEELPSKEAAKVLKKTDNSVRQSLFKGRKLLREMLTIPNQGKE